MRGIRSSELKRKFQAALPASQVVKSVTRKFQPRLQCIQSATGENLTEAAQIADRWKGYCEDWYHDVEGKRTEQEYWEQEPPMPSVRHQVA